MKGKEPKGKQRKAIELSSGDVGVLQPQDSVESFTNPTDSIITKFQDYCDTAAEWDVAILRAYTSRIYNRIYDKCIKIKNLEYLRSSDRIFQLLVAIMKSTEDKIILANAGGIILHSTIIKVGLSRIQALKKAIEAGITEVILEKISTNDPNKCSTEMFSEYLLITEELAERDPSFNEKAMSRPDCIISVHSALRTMFLNRPSLMRPLIVIVCTFSLNQNAMVILLNDGFIVTIQNLLNSVGSRISLRLKRLLQGICMLSRSAAFTTRMLSSTILPCCIKVLAKWYKLQGKIGSTCLKYLVGIVQNTIAIENGVETLRVLGVDTIIQKICNRFPRTRTFDKLLPRIVSILLAIRGQTDLPVETFECPFKFNLPKIKKLEESDGDSSDSDDGSDKEDEDNQGDDKTLEPLTKQSIPTPSSTHIDLSFYNDLWLEFTPKKFPFGSDQSKLLENLDSDVIQDMYNTLTTPIKPKKDRRMTALIMSGNINDIKSAYIDIHSRIHNLMPFVKLAYPDLNNSDRPQISEPLASVGKKKFRAKLIAAVKKSSGTLRSSTANPVYDLDSLIQSYPVDFKMPGNNDAARVGVKGTGTSLMFESRFESGNLRKAYQVTGFEYDLVLSPDVNSKRHLNWFYFEVSNMVAGENYTFNIINCERCKSQFSFGMKPVMYSVKEYILGKPGWKRIGSEIYYYKNSFFRPPGKDNKRRTYYTASFTIKFPHSYDICYIAYHYPYTYSSLLAHLWEWQRVANSSIFRVEKLCHTMTGNEVPLITITNPTSEENPLKKRELVFITGRVHPGESNSSWVMQGLINSLLLSDQAFVELRNKFVFKIIPMLNIEGVVHGCSRCGLSDEDLNRRWRNPDPLLHPSIYHAKGLIQYAKNVLHKNPYLYCDFHGHTTRKNVFLYGCCPNVPIKDKPEGDLETDNEREKELVGKLARVMKECSDVFSISSCRYNVAKLRESTARVTIWKELGVRRSYTMETSFCGSDTGPNKGHHLGLKHLLGIGESFCLALGRLDKASPTPSKSTSEHKAPLGSSLPPDEGTIPSNYERGIVLSANADQ